MQKIVSTLVLILFVQLFSLSIFAQSPPEAINYQAVARNVAGVPMVNQSISVQYAILQGSSSGTVVYSETHAETTNQFGLFTSEIGLGSVNSGNFSTINWGSSIFYLQVTVDGDLMPATQLLSVPYALHAKTATSGVPGVDGHNSLISSIAEPAGVNCTNGGYFIQSWLDLNDDGLLSSGETPISYYICNGADGANGLNGNDGVGIDSTIHNADGTLTIYYSNSTTYTTNDLTGPAGSGGTTYFEGNGISLSGDTITNLGDADSDPTNEIQLLSLNATSDTIFLTNGGFVALPSASGDTDWIQGSGVIYNTTDMVGIGTSTPTSPLTIENANATDIEFVGAGNSDIVAPGQLNIEAAGATLMDASDIYLRTNLTDRVTILNNGNVGVGTTTPTTNLDVVGRTKTDSITISDGASAGAVLTAMDAFGNAEWQLPSSSDNWGNDTVNVTGANIMGSGTVLNPLMVIDNDTSAINELQVLSISNDTLFLSNGGFVQLPSSSDGNGIYSGSDTLSGPTTVYQNANTLTFSGGAMNSTAVFSNGGFLGTNVNIEHTGTNGTGIKFLGSTATTPVNYGYVGASSSGLNMGGGTNSNNLTISTTGNVGINGLPSGGGKFVVNHSASTAEPTMHLRETTGNLNRIKMSNNTIANKYWEIGAQTNASDVTAGWSVNYFDGTTYRSHIISYGNGNLAIGKGILAANSSLMDVFGTTTLHDTLTIDNGSGSPYSFPVTDGVNPGEVLTTDAAGNTYWGSAASASPWTQAGDSLYTNISTSKVGIGTNIPKSVFQIANSYHLDTISGPGGALYNILSNNLLFNGLNFERTISGTGVVSYMGGSEFGVEIYGDGTAGSIASSSLASFTLDTNQARIETVGQGLTIRSSSDTSLYLQHNLGLGNPTIVFNSSGWETGLRASSSSSTNLLFTLPDSHGNSGEVLTTDGFGTMNWVDPTSFAAAALWTDASPNIHYSTGNVGIGTATPSQLLTLSTASSTTLRMEKTNTSAYDWELNVDNTGFHIKGGADGPTASLFDFVNINELGNMGIGTTSPSARLDVDNTVEDISVEISNTNNSSNFTYAIKGENAGTGTGDKYGAYLEAIGGNTTGNNTGIYAGASNAGVANTAISTNATASGTSNGTGIFSSVGGAGSGVTYGVYGQNSSSATGVSYGGYFRNMNTQGSLIYGVRSEVNGTSTSDQFGFRADVNGTSSGAKYGLYSVVLNGTGTQYGVYSNVSGGATNWAGFFAAGDVFVNENVGIGTSTPHAPLQFGTALTNRKIVLFEAANNDHEFFGFGINGGLLRYQANGHHVFYTATSSTASAELMRITSIGNVGIGITNPTQKLHVLNGTIRIDDGVKPYNLPSSDGSNSGDVLTTDAAGNTSWQTLPSAIWSQSGSEIHYNSGHVGIGNSNPNYLFHIQDSTASAGTVLMQVETMLGLPILRIDNDQKLDINGSLKLNDGSQGVGHVLTSIDAAGNATWKGPVNFGVNSCVMGIPAGTTTGLIFDNVEYDNGGNFNVGTGQFKAPEDGIYHVDAVVSFDVSSNFEIQLQILRNGGTYKRVTVYADPSNSTITAQISADVYLLANNTVSVGIYQNSGGTISPVTGGAVSAVYFNGHLVR
jgi:C1q domain-containing protein